MRKHIKSKVIEILDKIPLAKNLARKKFINDFLFGLIESRKVQFAEIATHIDSTAKPESTERRIQAFFKDYEFDYQQVCFLLCLFLPKGKITLSIDRTEWDFVKYQCNILLIAARCGNMGIPLYWELLDNNSGNSNAKDRCALLNKLIAVIGKSRIKCIVGDREFVGIEWVKHLKTNGIGFCMRLPKHHSITLKNGNEYFISQLLGQEVCRYFQNCLVDGIVCNAMLKKLPDGDYLFLIGNFYAKDLGKIYRYRWCIEVLFQNMKKRGFDLESTHLNESEKLSKLLVFVSLAVAICLKMGEFYHANVQNIKTKKHGYLANSFFRKGLDIIRIVLKNRQPNLIEAFKQAIQEFIKYIPVKIKYMKIIG